MKTKTAPVHLDASHLSDEFDKSKKTTEWTTYRCHLVTPMYGGGVRAGVVDRQQPFRATAIRGQLRQWWRWANESRFKTPEGKPDHQALFDAERKLWGGLGDDKTLRASRVVVRVLEAKNSTKNFEEWGMGDGGIGSVKRQILMKKDQKIKVLSSSKNNNTVEFLIDWKIIESTKEDTEQVEQSFRLWATFGGVGARRRRGLGAVEVFDKNSNLITSTKEDRATCGALVQMALPIKIKKDITSYQKAVEMGLKCFYEFRQGPDIARGEIRDKKIIKKDGKETWISAPGGTFWPEAGSIRALTKKARQKNSDDLRKFATKQLFPRAFFGLPIQFQFKAPDSNGDPPDCTLYPSSKNGNLYDRMASPLIFSAIKNPDETYTPCLFILNAKNQLYKMDMQLKIEGKNDPVVIQNWWPSEIDLRNSFIPKKIKRSDGDNGDVLKIFWNFFKTYNPKTENT